MKALVIIPAYNEGKNIAKLLDKLKEDCPEYDVLVVNDCSCDSTSDICKKRGVPVIDLPVNLGIGGAVQTGYKYAQYKGYDQAVQVDGDGQHDPRYIRALFSELDKGANLSIGSRFLEGDGYQSSRARRLGIKYFSSLIYLFTGQRVKDPTSGFRACDRSAVSLFAVDYPRDYPEPESIVNASRHKLKVSEVPVVMSAREGGKSSITNTRSLYYMVKVSLAIVIASFYPKTFRR
ncbi:MAG: glycosyltransferase family 2 protein [Clostridiaceae bacterium]